jgi:hypothetical protein
VGLDILACYVHCPHEQLILSVHSMCVILLLEVNYFFSKETLQNERKSEVTTQSKLCVYRCVHTHTFIAGNLESLSLSFSLSLSLVENLELSPIYCPTQRGTSALPPLTFDHFDLNAAVTVSLRTLMFVSEYPFSVHWRGVCACDDRCSRGKITNIAWDSECRETGVPCTEVFFIRGDANLSCNIFCVSTGTAMKRFSLQPGNKTKHVFREFYEVLLILAGEHLLVLDALPQGLGRM